jgi:hypothetical protein
MEVFKYSIYIKMASLGDLLNAGIVNVNDSIEFSFKGNHFTAKILRGGLVGICTLRRPHETSTKRILKGTTSFSSLTAWTEACLQDELEEYYTRYSSWKRVIHVESKQSLGDLRDRCKLTNSDECDTIDLYKEIARLQSTITEMNTYIQRLCNGEHLGCKQWEFTTVKRHNTQRSPRKKRIKIDRVVHSSAQAMLLNEII